MRSQRQHYVTGRRAVVAILASAAIMGGCGQARGAGQQLPQVAATSTIPPTQAPPSTTSPQEVVNRAVVDTVPVFTGLAKAGDLQVIDLTDGSSFPDDLPPGTYRLRLPGQEKWPDECLGESIVTPPPPQVPPATVQWSRATQEAVAEAERSYREAKQAAYVAACGSVNKDVALVTDAVGPVAPSPVPPPPPTTAP